MLYQLGMVIGMTPLFAYITFSTDILYPTYEFAPRVVADFTAGEDQLLYEDGERERDVVGDAVAAEQREHACGRQGQRRDHAEDREPAGHEPRSEEQQVVEEPADAEGVAASAEQLTAVAATAAPNSDRPANRNASRDSPAGARPTIPIHVRCQRPRCPVAA